MEYNGRITNMIFGCLKLTYLAPPFVAIEKREHDLLNWTEGFPRNFQTGHKDQDVIAPWIAKPSRSSAECRDEAVKYEAVLTLLPFQHPFAAVYECFGN